MSNQSTTETATKTKFDEERKQLQQKSILEVAESLGMTFNGNEWTEHDSFKLNLKKNTASWYSRGEEYRNMDVFTLVMRMRDVSFKEAYQFVKTGDFKAVEIKNEPKKPFSYYLEKFEDPSFSKARAYLKNERQLSDETIDFFISQGVLAQATRRTNIEMSTELPGAYYYDPVIVFKTLDRYNKVIGTSMVGIDDNRSIYELEGKPIKRKQIGYNSDGLGGVNISIGTPKRIIVSEAPIDLMSYYELHKADLNDVMLVALDGSSTKLSSVKRYVMDVLTDKEWSLNPERSNLNETFKLTLENTDAFKQQPDLITVAVDNDKAGQQMLEDFKKQNIPVIADLPPLHDDQTKNDWNDELKTIKGGKVVTTTQNKEASMTEAVNQKSRFVIEFSEHPKLEAGQEVTKELIGQMMSYEGYDSSGLYNKTYIDEVDETGKTIDSMRFDLGDGFFANMPVYVELAQQMGLTADDIEMTEERREIFNQVVAEKAGQSREVENSTLEENPVITLQSVGFADGYEDTDEFPDSLMLTVQEVAPYSWDDDSQIFVKASLVYEGEEVIHTPFVIDNPGDFNAWWEDNYEAVEEQIYASDEVVSLLEELEFRKLPQAEQQAILDKQNGVIDLFEDTESKDPTWAEVLEKAPEWLRTAYEMDENDYPAKTFPSGDDALMSDFGLEDDLPLTDDQKIDIQMNRVFYDDDNNFRSFKEALEIAGASIPDNMPEVSDDRPTAQEEAQWLLERENTKSSDAMKFEKAPTFSVADIKQIETAGRRDLRRAKHAGIVTDIAFLQGYVSESVDDFKVSQYVNDESFRPRELLLRDFTLDELKTSPYLEKEDLIRYRMDLTQKFAEKYGYTQYELAEKQVMSYGEKAVQVQVGSHKFLIDYESGHHFNIGLLTEAQNDPLETAYAGRYNSNASQFKTLETAWLDVQEAVGNLNDQDSQNVYQQFLKSHVEEKLFITSKLSFTAGEERDNALEIMISRPSRDKAEHVKVSVTRYFKDEKEGMPIVKREDFAKDINTSIPLETAADLLTKFYAVADVSENALEVFEKLPAEYDKIQAELVNQMPLNTPENSESIESDVVEQENEQVEQPETESFRLTQARQKLKRLEGEYDVAVQDVFDHQKLTNGQPMNDKRTGGTWFKHQNQKEDKASELLAEIKAQRERIENLEWREDNARLGLNASGGLVKSVDNIERWEQRVERLEFVRDYNKSHGLPLGTPYDNGENIESYDSKKLKDAKETVKKLSEIKEKSERATAAISPEAQALIDSGAVNQWKKQPTYYFVKGLRKVALELDAETGNFKVSSNRKYAPKTAEDKAKVEELLTSNDQIVKDENQENEAAQNVPQAKVTNDTDNLEKQSGSQVDGEKVENSTSPDVSDDNDQAATYFVFKNDEDLFWLSSNSWGIETTHLFDQALKFEDSLMADGYLGSLDLQGVETPEQYGYHKTQVDAKGQTIELEHSAEDIALFDNLLDVTPELSKDSSEMGIKKDDVPKQSSEIEETNFSSGFLSSETKGSSAPDSDLTESFDTSVTSVPTVSPHLPQFSINGEYLSNRKQGYTVATEGDIEFLNTNVSTILEAAEFYDEKMKNEIFHYVTVDEVGNFQVVPVRYGEENFAHLTGISLVDNDRELPAKAILQAFVNEELSHQSILVTDSNAFENKIKVLDQLKNLATLDSVYMKDFSQVRGNIRFDDAFKTESDDLMLAMKDFGDEFLTPYSLMNTQSNSTKNKFSTVDNLRPVVAIFDEERTKSGSSIGLLDYDKTIFENVGDIMSLQKMMTDVILTADRSNDKLPEYSKAAQAVFEELEKEEKTMVDNQEIPLEGIQNPDGSWEWDFDKIVEHAFEQRDWTTDLFKTADGQYDRNEAWQCLVEDVHDAKYQYADLDDKPKLEAWLAQRDAYFYKSITANKVEFNPAAVDKFLSLYVPAIERNQESLRQEKMKAEEKEMAQPIKNQTHNEEIPLFKDLTEVSQDKTPEVAVTTPDTVRNFIQIETDKISFELSETVNGLLDEVEKSAENSTQYLTKSEIETLLDDHMKRIEGIITQFSDAYNKMENPTQAQTQSLLKQMFEAIRHSLQEFKAHVTQALNTKKATVTDKVDDVRLAVKNGINRKILGINEKLKGLATRIDEKFALEEKTAAQNSESDKVATTTLENDATVQASQTELEVTPESKVTPQPTIKVRLGERPQADIDEAIENDVSENVVLEKSESVIPEVEVTPAERTTDVKNEVKLEANQDIINAANAKDTEALSAHLKAGVKQYLNSDQYKQFLNAMSQFHHYSPGNIQLILAQKPDAKLVATAGRWKSEFERFPAKDSKPIYIWDYRERLAKDEQGKVFVDENGQPKKEHYFVLAPKFDVSQTVGKDLPKGIEALENVHELDHTQAANLYRALKMTSQEKGVPVTIEAIPDGANSSYNPDENSITINKGMSQTETLKTLIHEMAYSDLHNKAAGEKTTYAYSNQELQAESVAYVVANHYGIDTSGYSFAYLANWSDDQVGLSDLEAQLKIVQQEAKNLIARLDTNMEKLLAVQAKHVPQNPFEAKLAQEKENTKQEISQAKDATIKKDLGVHR